MTICLREVLSLFVLQFMLAGCVSADAGNTTAFKDAVAQQSSSEPMLRPGDRVQVTVFGETAITGSYDVAASGTIQVPLAGSVEASGQTAQELETKITAALQRKYLRDPKVTVAILTLHPFYVLGEVEKPGEYPYRSGLNLWRALAVAGGQTYRASSSSVLIQHAGETTTAEYDLTQDVIVRPGDLIRVPERWF
ncbi:polysaccharide biosynthesis/export family protein [Lichenifustis flavocetrariae]|uniref:Polysaccharide export protein n=1 Tax=Lichenifustis flavocetrariae TaxID=2949735 RepID=A0AA42CKP0_9HYPH|nr:polysaccharide biosynthesis/export family protein [Lichenifustis flavocetrariae]MCW6506557.1 polysaccharide export protein [Lichenifustis flavocetrariae]